MNICIVVGHTKIKYGAVSKRYGISEYDYNTVLTKKIKTIAENNRHLCYVIYKDGFSCNKEVVQKINSFPYDMVIELHCNALDTKSRGTLVFYANESQKYHLFSTILYNNIRTCFERFNVPRGAQLLKEGDRGFFNINEVNYPCALVEPFFIDNDEDCQLGMNKVDDYALCLFRSCFDFIVNG